MISPELLALYLAGGVLAGVLAGLFGIGGGTLLVPLFIFTLSGTIPQEYLVHSAVASALACIVFTSVNSAWSQHRARMVDWEMVRWLGAGLVAGVIIGSLLAAAAPGELLKAVIVGVLLFATVQHLSGWVPTRVLWHPSAGYTLPTGAGVGVLSSMAGLGGGMFIVPILRLGGIDIHRAVASSAACGVFVSVSALVMYSLATPTPSGFPEYTTGYVYWPAVAVTGLASGAMARVGVWLNHRMHQRLLRWLYGIKSFIIASWLVFGA